SSDAEVGRRLCSAAGEGEPQDLPVDRLVLAPEPTTVVRQACTIGSCAGRSTVGPCPADVDRLHTPPILVRLLAGLLRGHGCARHVGRATLRAWRGAWCSESTIRVIALVAAIPTAGAGER